MLQEMAAPIPESALLATIVGLLERLVKDMPIPFCNLPKLLKAQEVRRPLLRHRLFATAYSTTEEASAPVSFVLKLAGIP